MVFFLHFLMMTSALLSLSCSYEACHALKDFICPSKMFMNEVAIVNLEEPVIQFVLLKSPMPFLYVFCLFLWAFNSDITIFLLSLFFVFLAGQANMAFFSKQRLKVITWYHLFLVSRIIQLTLIMNGFRLILANLTFWPKRDDWMSWYWCLLGDL